MSFKLREVASSLESELASNYSDGFKTDGLDERERVKEQFRNAISGSEYELERSIRVYVDPDQSGEKSLVVSIVPKEINRNISAQQYNKFGVVLNFILFPPEGVCFIGVAHGHIGNQSEDDIAGFAEKIYGRTHQYLQNESQCLDWKPLSNQGPTDVHVGERLAQVGNNAAGSSLSFESEGQAVRGNIVKAMARRLSSIFAGKAYRVGVNDDLDNLIPSDQQVLSTFESWLDALEGAGFREARDVEPFLDESRTFDSGQTSDLDVDFHTFLDVSMPDDLVGLEDSWRQAKIALAEGKHVILYGPPGSGKTVMAEKLCEVARVDFIETVASSDWSNFDAVGGYTFENDGSTRFQEGVFLKSISKNKWLLVDEINRANIDRAVGSLFGILVSSHDENEERTVTLPFSESSRDDGSGGRDENITVGNHGEASYNVNPDWRIVATMNTLDKASLFRLSYAFMRRFAFVEVPSLDGDMIRSLLSSRLDLNGLPDVAGRSVDEALANLSDSLAEIPEVSLSTAILLDVGRLYCQTVNSYGGIDPADAFLEAMNAVAFSQFEGFRDHHDQICNVIHEVLDLSDDKRRELSNSLATWTGQKID